MTSDEEVLGVVVLARHGDRQGLSNREKKYLMGIIIAKN